ncbi:hypothetical protein B0T21DRAFT_7219 [Apiosordaria backusii]|uniref:Uncharacterized protein n=1 Tax=Apiosordaria backusii TaxID=314023 RepID=A0AA40K6A6_9PEZI|nr:hypothetical protein B0T21DRAFT_7219 [Apiosordaria backusii]
MAHKVTPSPPREISIPGALIVWKKLIKSTYMEAVGMSSQELLGPKPGPVNLTTTSSLPRASPSICSQARSNQPGKSRNAVIMKPDLCSWILAASPSSRISDIIFPLLLPTKQAVRFMSDVHTRLLGPGGIESQSSRIVRRSCEHDKRVKPPGELMRELISDILPRVKVPGSGKGVSELWVEFWERVLKSGIKQLVILLEETDRFFEACYREGPEGQQRFRDFTAGLRPPSSVLGAGIFVKVVVACSSKEVAALFEKKWERCSESFDD